MSFFMQCPTIGRNVNCLAFDQMGEQPILEVDGGRRQILHLYIAGRCARDESWVVLPKQSVRVGPMGWLSVVNFLWYKTV